MESCQKVKVKGVITRSQYLEASKPKDKGAILFYFSNYYSNYYLINQFKILR